MGQSRTASARSSGTLRAMQANDGGSAWEAACEPLAGRVYWRPGGSTERAV